MTNGNNYRKTIIHGYIPPFTKNGGLNEVHFGWIKFGNLHEIVTSLLQGNDGSQAVVKSFKVFVLLLDESPAYHVPVIVQTAGAVLANYWQVAAGGSYDVNACLNLVVDDVLGFSYFGQSKHNHRVFKTINDKWDHETRYKLTLNQKVLNILNKEVETERLQDLYIGVLIFYIGVVTDDILPYMYAEVEWMERRKDIVIR